IAFTRSHVGQQIAITVLRDGARLTLEATPALSVADKVGRLGIGIGEGRVRSNPIAAAGKAVVETGSTTKAVVLQLGKVVGPGGLSRIWRLLSGWSARRATDPVSIVGGAQLAGEAVRAGLWDQLLAILVVFNVFVGILNLVPLPPLDGGHLAVLAYEKIRRRK